MHSLFRALILMSLMTISALAHADDKAVQKALTANYTKFNLAFKKNDLTVFSNMLAPDYVAIQPNGQKVGAKEMITNFTREHDSLKNPAIESKIASLTVKGNEATATVHGRLVGTMIDPRNKEAHKLLVVAQSKDTWIKRDGVWKLKTFQVIHQTVTLDGKPLNGAGSAGPGNRGGTPGR